MHAYTFTTWTLYFLLNWLLIFFSFNSEYLSFALLIGVKNKNFFFFFSRAQKFSLLSSLYIHFYTFFFSFHRRLSDHLGDDWRVTFIGFSFPLSFVLMLFTLIDVIFLLLIHSHTQTCTSFGYVWVLKYKTHYIAQ